MHCVQATLYLILIVHTLVTGICLLWHMKRKQYLYFTEEWPSFVMQLLGLIAYQILNFAHILT